MKPVARRNGLVVRDLADEVVVYDKERHEAHCLNGTAATVFRNANGQRNVSDLALLLSADGGPGAEELVEMALGQLGVARPDPDVVLARAEQSQAGSEAPGSEHSDGDRHERIVQPPKARFRSVGAIDALRARRYLPRGFPSPVGHLPSFPHPGGRVSCSPTTPAYSSSS